VKLATFERASGAAAVGIVDTQRGALLDLAQAGAPFGSLLQLIEAGDQGLAQARAAAARWPAQASRPLAGTRLLAPLPVPQSIRDCLVFETHLQNAMKAWEKLANRPATPIPKLWYQRPTWYKGNRFSVVGHEAEVQWPPYSEMMDFELELACVIGRKGRDIPAAKGLDHIFGFTVFNDFSARDTQMEERPLGMGPMKGKDFDTGNVFGPWIVTTDEIGDPQQLGMEVRVNGERWGGGNSRDMQHSFAKILAFISGAETLHPGEIIASGTVGTGCGLELTRFLKPNDVVELEIENIGVLRNRIVRPAA
jgi:2-keto-4-pentenoate hydratase/2-oxohepta-3-ene-1,7-dioic acid hydratase in catechol pathway